jgi:replicative DNA helicase
MTARRIVVRKAQPDLESPPARKRSVKVRKAALGKPKRVQHGKDWHPEQALISTVIDTGNINVAVEKGVTDAWFHAYPEEWKYITKYVNRHRKPPTGRIFTRNFPDFEYIEQEDLDYLIEECRQAHARHSLLIAVDTAMEGLKEGGDVLDLVRTTEKHLITLHGDVDGYSNQSDMTDWRSVYDEVASRVDRTKRHGMAGIPTGFPTLDMASGGAGPGEYWVIGARLGNGKTWMMAAMAAHAAVAGHSSLFFALEQSRAQVHMRTHNLLSSKFGKEIFRSIDLMRGKNFDLYRYRQFCQKLSAELKGNIIVDDTPRGKLTPMTIAAQIEKHQPNIVFIDYIQLMNLGADWQSMAAISGQLKGIASVYNVPIVAASQINRVGIGKEPPRAEHIAESDAIGRDVDAVVTLVKRTERVLKFRFAKYRHGPDGQKWWVNQDLNAGVFREVNGNEAAEIMDEDRANGEVEDDS